MKRRGFLALIGGAGIAGPSVAKNVVTEVMPLSGSGIGAVFASRGVLPGGNGGSLFAELDRVSKLKRLIAGEEEDEPEPYEVAHIKRILVEHSINALRSVSATRKVAIMRRDVMAIEKEKRRSYWVRELLGLEGRE